MTQRLIAPRALVLGLLALGTLSAAPAMGARWDTYNNANSLNSVKAVAGATWCASDLGLHRFDVASGRFSRYSKATNQLVSNAVSEVEVDALGNTWFGTRDKGVSVLTPLGEWRTLTAFEGLPSAVVTCLEPSAVGMWVGTANGLALFDGLTLEAVWPDGVNPSPFVSNVVNAIAIVGDSTYVATADGVYVTRSSEGVTWQRRTSGLSSTNVRAISGSGGDVWCASGNEVYRGGQSGAWTQAQAGLGGATVRTLAGKPSGLYAGASNGVYRWEGGAAWQAIGAGSPANAWVDEDPGTTLWAGNSQGLWRWTGSYWQLRTAPGPGGNWVQGMQLRGSTVFVSTRDRGVARFDGSSWRTFTPSAGATPDTTLIAPNVFGLLADRDGTIWAGQWDGGITRINDTTDPPSTLQYYDPLEPTYDRRDTFVWSSAVAPDGARWFGLDTPLLGTITPRGLNRVALDESRSNYNPQDGKAMSGPQIRAIAFAPGAAFEMWVAYARLGVDIFTDPTLNTRAAHLAASDSAGLLNDDTWAIEMNGDSVWIATSDGLSRYSRASRKRVENIGTQAPSSQGAIHPLSIDAEGGVWWATQGGVFHRRPDRSVEIFTANNSPLLSDDVHAVYADRATGDIWIGSVLGVNRYNPSAAPAAGGGVPSGSKFGVFPNPAFLSAAGTVIRASDVAGPFKGKVYDLNGRVVKRLLGNASTGALWDGTDENGQRVRPGVYFFQIQAGGVTRQSRVLLLR
ncbi:MAG: T9SS type A sorting domain-containing protein [Candidatus Eisenbacteria bacterium]